MSSEGLDDTPVAPADDLPSSLLSGVDAAVCGVLDVRSLRHRTAVFSLCARPRLPNGSVVAAYDMIAANWRRCRASRPDTGSRENWRWRVPQPGIAVHNASPEVMLERAMVATWGRLGRTDLANQVPIASGVAGPYGERRRAIDLVRQVDSGRFELIELKIGSDTPLFAAFEIIWYACIWLLSRSESRIAPNVLLDACRIDARVLAPRSYYARYALGGLQRLLDAELAALGQAHSVELSFAFEAFEDDLGQSPFTDDRLMRLLDTRQPL